MKMGTKIFLGMTGLGIYFTAGSFIPVAMLLHTLEQTSQGIVAEGMFLKAALVLLAILAIGLLLSWFLAQSIKNSIAAPLRQVEKASEQAANGNFKSSISCDSDDEIGSLIKNYTLSMGKVKAILAELSGVMEQMTKGESNPSFREKYGGDFAELKRNTEQLGRMMRDLKKDDMRADRTAASTASSPAASRFNPGAVTKPGGSSSVQRQSVQYGAGIAAKTAPAKPVTQPVKPMAAPVKPMTTPAKPMTAGRAVTPRPAFSGASSPNADKPLSAVNKKEFMYGLDKY